MRLSKKAEALFSTSSWNSYHGNMLPISGREKASNGLLTSSLQSSKFRQSCGFSYKQLKACLTDIIYAKRLTFTAQSTTTVTSECNKIHETTSQSLTHWLWQMQFLILEWMNKNLHMVHKKTACSHCQTHTVHIYRYTGRWLWREKKWSWMYWKEDTKEEAIIPGCRSSIESYSLTYCDK